jgi:peptidoglycan/LPS O-acetylase OafA/YrhL
MGILRFLLAVAVVIAHSSAIFGFSFVGGQIAVQAFYMISGFYMALILNEKYVGVNKSYKLFISNRLLRLFPIYWTVLLIVILYSLVLAISSHGNNVGEFSAYKQYYSSMGTGSLVFLVFTNLFLFLQDAVLFLGLDTTSGNLFFTSNFRNTDPMLYKFLFIPQAWTIGIEVAFYLIAPFIARRKLNVILVLVALSLALRIFLYFGMNLKNDPWTYRFFPTELVFFLLGIVAYNIYKKLKPVKLEEIYLKAIWYTVVGFTLFYSFLPFGFKNYLYIVAFFAALPFIFIYTKSSKRDAYIGELSYPIYISHMLVLTFLKLFIIPKAYLGLTLTIVTILFSILLNELIAKKIEKIRQKRVVVQ